MKEHSKKYQLEIIKIRKKIDKIDDNILKLFAKRFLLVKKIGIIKLKLKLPLRQSNRMQQVQNIWIKKSKQLDISKAFIKDLFHLLHEESVREQSVIQKKEKSK